MKTYIYMIRLYINGEITTECYKNEADAKAKLKELNSEALAELEGLELEVNNSYDDSFHIIGENQEYYCTLEEKQLL